MRAGTTIDADLVEGRWNATTAGTVLAAWQASGMSLAAFGRWHGIGVWRLNWWRKQLGAGAAGQRKGLAPVASLSLVPATVVSSSGGTRDRISVRLPSGIEVEAADVNALPVEWLARLARELRTP